MTDWFIIKSKNENLGTWIEKNNYYDISIYGIGSLGQCLLAEVEKNFNIVYLIDRRKINSKIKCYSPDDFLPKTDLIIVTAVYDFDEIYDKLYLNMNCPIVSLEQIIEEQLAECMIKEMNDG